MRRKGSFEITSERIQGSWETSSYSVAVVYRTLYIYDSIETNYRHEYSVQTIVTSRGELKSMTITLDRRG